MVFVPYQAQRDADEFLKRVLNDDRGIGVFFGVKSSGKTTIVHNFIRSLPATVPVAVVDGNGIGAIELLAMMLSQFGYKGAIELAATRSKLLAELSQRVVREDQAPVLVLENVSDMHPGGLLALRDLAALTIRGKFALRIILSDRRDCSDIVGSPRMNPISARLIDSFELRALTARETVNYLQTKLRSSGVAQPHRVLPIATCVQLHKHSGGRPGLLDDLALHAIARADRPPVRREHVQLPTTQNPPLSDRFTPTAMGNIDTDQPKLLLTQNGKLLQEIDVQQAKIIFGRARLNDVVLNNQYVSKYHAMLVTHNKSMFLIDLKSSNGIFVNSRRVRETVLRHDDIIEIGNFRLKVFQPLGQVHREDSDSDLADTSLMKTVADMRKAVARKISQAIPSNRRKSK